MLIKYNTFRNTYSYEVVELQRMLAKEGYLNANDIDGYYGLKTEKVYKAYQYSQNKFPDGIFDTKTLDLDDTYDNFISGKLPRANTSMEGGSNGSTDSTDSSGSGTEKDNVVEKEEKDTMPFFNDNKSYVFRKGTVDIVIEYSNSDTQKRTIEDVHIRSMSQIIDTNGDAIADVYNFVAKDVIENNG